MRWDSWPAPAAAAGASALYARTLAPGLTWAHSGADGGDLLAAALVRGVPHPPGYPTYQLLLRAALQVFPGEPARAGNWLSAFCMAAAAALVADLARRMLAHSPGGVRPWHGLTALAAALAWAAAPAVWGQATITEVYGLHVLAALAVLWLLWRWREVIEEGAAGTRYLALAGLVWGLGMGNHLSLALLLPGVLAWLWAGRRAAGATMRRDALAVVLFAVAGLSVYIYLPWAAAAAPLVNWGDPRTPSRFAWVASGWLYHELVFGLPVAEWPGRLAAVAGELLRQFGVWGALLAVAGLWRIDRRQHPWWRTTVLVALAYIIYAVGYDTGDAWVYLLPAWAMLALWLAVGLGWAGEALSIRVGGARTAVAVAVLAAVLLPGLSVARFWPENDLSHDTAARDFVSAALADAAPDAVILTATDGPTFALWYTVYGLGQRPDVLPLNVNLYGFAWYGATLHRYYPELMLSAAVRGAAPPLAQLVLRNAADRPFYRAEPLDLALPGLRETPVGALVRILPE